MADGDTLEEDRQYLLLGAGVSMLNKNRPPDTRGMPYGGVALFFKEDICNFKPVNICTNDFEILVAAGSMRGHTRKVVIVAAYIPPNYNTQRANDCLDTIHGIIVEVKRRACSTPYKLRVMDLSGSPTTRSST